MLTDEVNSIFHKLYYNLPAILYEEMDFFTGKAEVDRDEIENIPPEPRNVWESMRSNVLPVYNKVRCANRHSQKSGPRSHKCEKGKVVGNSGNM